MGVLTALATRSNASMEMIFSPLDFAEIFRIQAHLLGQSFLGVATAFPAEADGFTNHAPMS